MGSKHVVHELEMLGSIASPTEQLALILGNRRHAGLAHRIVEGLKDRTPQRLRIAGRYNADQALESEARALRAACSIGANKPKPASKALDLNQRKALLTRSEDKHVGRSIEFLERPLGNRLEVDESWVVGKRSIK